MAIGWRHKMHFAHNDKPINLYDAAKALGIPLRPKDQVSETLTRCAETGTDIRMAQMMLAHGRLTDEAREYVREYLA